MKEEQQITSFGTNQLKKLDEPWKYLTLGWNQPKIGIFFCR